MPRGKRQPTPSPEVFTIGHSTRSLDELIELLRAHGIQRLVDVRTIPRSRHNPQFNRDALGPAVRAVGIGYIHMKSLGGLRRARPDSINTGWRNASFRGYADYMQTAEFERGLDRLIGMASRKRVAIMCAEAVPFRCHRWLIADALTARGLTVRHIASRRTARPHEISPWARVKGGRVTYPGQ